MSIRLRLPEIVPDLLPKLRPLGRPASESFQDIVMALDGLVWIAAWAKSGHGAEPVRHPGAATSSPLPEPRHWAI
jgi:hypothetical protein